MHAHHCCSSEAVKQRTPYRCCSSAAALMVDRNLLHCCLMRDVPTLSMGTASSIIWAMSLPLGSVSWKALKSSGKWRACSFCNATKESSKRKLTVLRSGGTNT